MREIISEGFVDNGIDFEGIGPNPFDYGSVDIPECHPQLSRQQIEAIRRTHDVLTPSSYNGLDIYVQVRQCLLDIS